MFGSLALFAVATMAGAQYADGALIGGALVTLFPELLRRLDLPQDLGNVLFAVGAVQALSSGETMSEGLRRAFGRLSPRRAIAAATLDRAELPPRRDHGDASRADGAGLTVRYGAVVALDTIDFYVPARKVTGLIGPNGAGKSTFIDAVTGFLPRYEGRIELQGRPLEGQLAHHRARLGGPPHLADQPHCAGSHPGAYLRLASGGLHRSAASARRSPGSAAPTLSRRSPRSMPGRGACSMSQASSSCASRACAARRTGRRTVLRRSCSDRQAHRGNSGRVRLRGTAGRSRHGLGARRLRFRYGARLREGHRIGAHGESARSCRRQDRLSGH